MIGASKRIVTRRVAEDAAEDCVTYVTVVTRYPWQCPRCTHANAKMTDFCAYCSWDRDDEPWLCPECFHLNHFRSAECETCGRPKPEDR